MLNIPELFILRLSAFSPCFTVAAVALHVDVAAATPLWRMRSETRCLNMQRLLTASGQLQGA